MLPAPRSLLFAVLAAGLTLAAAPAHARLGDTLADIKKHRGSPLPQKRPDVALWVFEGVDGQLGYSVTFNAAGKSIAEGLKPIKNARLTPEIADDFMRAQLEPFRGSKTVRKVQPGEKYTFAGQVLTCGEDEAVIVDDPNGLLIVWTKGALASVVAVSAERLK